MSGMRSLNQACGRFSGQLWCRARDLLPSCVLTPSHRDSAPPGISQLRFRSSPDGCSLAVDVLLIDSDPAVTPGARPRTEALRVELRGLRAELLRLEEDDRVLQ